MKGLIRTKYIDINKYINIIIFKNSMLNFQFKKICPINCKIVNIYLFLGVIKVLLVFYLLNIIQIII